MSGNFFGGAFFGGGFFGRIAEGIRKKRPVFKIKLSELDRGERLTTAQFLKEQLRKHEEIPVPKMLKELEKEQLVITAMDNMRKEALEEERIISINNQIISIILGAVDDT